MKTVQKELEAIAINLDFILNRMDVILKAEQKLYYSQLLKQQNLKNNLEKLNNMSTTIELVQDLEHIIKNGKNILNFILLENIIEFQKPKAKSQKPKAKSQKPKAIKL